MLRVLIAVTGGLADPEVERHGPVMKGLSKKYLSTNIDAVWNGRNKRKESHVLRCLMEVTRRRYAFLGRRVDYSYIYDPQWEIKPFFLPPI
jgi:hypothetical protein